MKTRSHHRRPRFLFGVGVVLLIGFFGAAPRAAEPVTILIKNVQLIDDKAVAEDVVVNILIKNNKLDIITLDDVDLDVAGIAIDGQKGFLLGKLDIGEPPSFVILDQDPRVNFEVLLDTKTHAQFAIHHGLIVKNNLPDLAEAEPAGEEEPKRSGWLAYSPPPLALPVDYLDTTRWNRWETKWISGLFTAAVILDRTRWLEQDAASVAQVGDLQEFEGGEIRGLRFGAVGTLNFPKPWVYTIFGATNAFDKGFDTTTTDDISWFDYRFDIPIAKTAAISIGKQKEPISMERLMSLAFEPLQERSAAADAMLPSRNHGIVLNGTAFNQRTTWGVGAFNNWIDSEQSFDDTANQFVGRVTWLPLVSADESNLLHLGFGVRHSDTKQGVQYLTEPEVDQAPVFVDTGPIAANGAMTYNLEASWRKGPLWVFSEYIYTDVDSTEFGKLVFDGYNIGATWGLTGEMRSYRKRSGIFDPVPVAKSVYQGGWGTWELAGRYSNVDLSDGPIDGGDMDIYTIGLNWWLTRTFMTNLNYRYITLDRSGTEGTSNALTARIMLILE